MTTEKLHQSSQTEGRSIVSYRIGMYIALFAAVLFVAVSGAQAADLERTPERLLEWTQDVHTVREGSVWQDVRGTHYRDFEQVAKLSGDCEAEVKIMVDGDVGVDGQGKIYGSLDFLTAPQGCFAGDIGSAAGYEGKFEFDVKSYRIADGSMFIASANGSQRLVVVELKHIGGSLLEPVLYLRGRSGASRITPAP